ncbi:hypothetical protein SDC9_191308 [bioreactor metagenome]|uniref:Uncharacterized protein n=1 Tax=bioreactor metagenome TaxID=1076179 RepID=A0A645HXL5_9ZZZZ
MILIRQDVVGRIPESAILRQRLPDVPVSGNLRRIGGQRLTAGHPRGVHRQKGGAVIGIVPQGDPLRRFQRQFAGFIKPHLVPPDPLHRLSHGRRRRKQPTTGQHHRRCAYRKNRVQNSPPSASGPDEKPPVIHNATRFPADYSPHFSV